MKSLLCKDEVAAAVGGFNFNRKRSFRLHPRSGLHHDSDFIPICRDFMKGVCYERKQAHNFIKMRMSYLASSFFILILLKRNEVVVAAEVRAHTLVSGLVAENRAERFHRLVRVIGQIMEVNYIALSDFLCAFVYCCR